MDTFSFPAFLAGAEAFWREFQMYKQLADVHWMAARLCAGASVFWINPDEPALVFLVAEGEEADDVEDIPGGLVQDVYLRWSEHGEDGIREWVAQRRAGPSMPPVMPPDPQSHDLDDLGGAETAATGDIDDSTENS